MQRIKQKALDDALETDRLPKSIYNLKTDIYAAMWPLEAQEAYITAAEELLKQRPELNHPLYRDRIETFKQNSL